MARVLRGHKLLGDVESVEMGAGAMSLCMPAPEGSRIRVRCSKVAEQWVKDSKSDAVSPCESQSTQVIFNSSKASNFFFFF